MKFRPAILGAMTVLSMAAGAMAQPKPPATAAELLRMYDSGSPATKRVVENYLGGVGDGLEVLDAALMLDKKPRYFCLPGMLAITNDQEVQILRDTVNRRKDLASRPTSVALLLGYEFTFPCKAPGH